MRSNIALIAAFALAATPFLSIVARSADLGHMTAARQANIVRVAQQCPAGEYWEDAGYVADGKWRDGHCAKATGHQ